MSQQIRACRPDSFDIILTIINQAAQAYRGVIPDDCCHEPYMPTDALRREIDAGVVFWGCEIDGVLAGVMGAQAVRNVDLIRHAYVLPEFQGRGVGSMLIEHVCAAADRQVLVGAWATAVWAIAFYERHGFAMASPDDKAALLDTYWSISPRQVETSVVLSKPPLGAGAAARVIAASG